MTCTGHVALLHSGNRPRHVVHQQHRTGFCGSAPGAGSTLITITQRRRRAGCRTACPFILTSDWAQSTGPATGAQSMRSAVRPSKVRSRADAARTRNRYGQKHYLSPVNIYYVDFGRGRWRLACRGVPSRRCHRQAKFTRLVRVHNGLSFFFLSTAGSRYSPRVDSISTSCCLGVVGAALSPP